MLRIKGNTIKLFLTAIRKVSRPLRAAHGPAVLRAEGGFGSLKFVFRQCSSTAHLSDAVKDRRDTVPPYISSEDCSILLDI